MKEEILLKLIEKLLDSDSPQNTQSSNLDDEHVGIYVLVRTYSAGVHFGLLKKKAGMQVVLDEARRIWSWEGAFTLSAVATSGVGDGKLSTKIDGFLTEAIEIMPLTATAKECLYGIEDHKG